MTESEPQKEGNQLHTILAPRPGVKASRHEFERRGFRREDEHAEVEEPPWRRQALQEDRRPASSCAAKAFKRHILTSKPTRRKRQMRGTEVVIAADARKLQADAAVRLGTGRI